MIREREKKDRERNEEGMREKRKKKMLTRHEIEKTFGQKFVLSISMYLSKLCIPKVF